MFFKYLISSKNGKVKLSVMPRTNEDCMSVSYGCVKFFHRIEFQQASLEELSQSLNEEDFIHLKYEFPNHWMVLSKNLA